MQVAVPGLMGELENGTSLVAASPLLAAAATQEYARFRIADGAHAWRRPAIHSLDAWLTSCWNEVRYSSTSVPVLLSPAQELVLWENAVREGGSVLFDPGSAARLARRTSRLAAEWQIDDADSGWMEHEDGRQFRLWAGRVRKACTVNGWMTRADLWTGIPSWMKAGLCSPGRIALVGFDRLSPGLRRLLDNVADFKVFLTDAEGSKPIGAPVLKPCANLEEELTRAARWSRYLLETNPRFSAGVFVPHLASQRKLVERVFKRVFQPGVSLGRPNGKAVPPASVFPFHIHASAPLWEEPLVAHALLLLELVNDRVDQANATAILRSPFIKGAQRERSARSQADLSIRKLRELDVDLRQMMATAGDCPELRSILSQVNELVRKMPAKAETAQWSAFIGNLLQRLGWPGDRELTAEDQDLVETWKDALSELGSLSLVMPPLSFESALGHLRRLLGRNRTEVGDWYSPVQILEASDADGLRFEHTFAVGLGDESWPPPQEVAALIPFRLQRDHRFPGSTPDLLLAERRRLTDGLLRSSPGLHGTYSGRLSPLVASAAADAGEWPEWGGNTPLQVFKPVKKDLLEDTYAPPLPSAEGVRGGTRIIRLQSICPFRAFAEVRLQSLTPENACFGMDARERGSFLHSALQYVWEELRDQATLKRTSPGDLLDLVARSVAKAVGEPADSELRAQTADVERSRLTELIYDWLVTIEKTRLVPFAVERTETPLDFAIAGLPMKLRVDRMDRLPNGQLVLIDYKSGFVTKGKLGCPRPEEPQLLVYATAKDAEVDGVFFGQLNSEELKMPGISRDRQVKGPSNECLGAEWENRTAEWAAHVESLAADFLKGFAAVDPIKCACDFCENKPLCRIREKAGATGEGNEAES